jgi:beta-lactamase class A
MNLTTTFQSIVAEAEHAGILTPGHRHAWIVDDLTSGERLVAINEEELFQAACMAKPYTALAFLDCVSRGEFIYGERSVKNIEALLRYSSHTAEHWLVSQIGGASAVTEILQEYQDIFPNTKIVNTIPRDGAEHENASCASDHAAFLKSIYQRRLPGSDELLRVMGLPKRNCFSTYVEAIPAGTIVHSKSGGNGYVCGDMGIIMARTAEGEPRPYIMVGLLQQSSKAPDELQAWWQWLGTQRGVIRKASAAAYSALKERYDLL